MAHFWTIFSRWCQSIPRLIFFSIFGKARFFRLSWKQPTSSTVENLKMNPFSPMLVIQILPAGCNKKIFKARSLKVYYWWCLIPGWEILPEKLGMGVRPAYQNPYPIYDQNLRFSLPYLWPDQKFGQGFNRLLGNLARLQTFFLSHGCILSAREIWKRSLACDCWKEFSDHPTPDKLEIRLDLCSRASKLTAWSGGKSDIIKCNVSSKTAASYCFKQYLENKVILDTHFVELGPSLHQKKFQVFRFTNE